MDLQKGEMKRFICTFYFVTKLKINHSTKIKIILTKKIHNVKVKNIAFILIFLKLTKHIISNEMNV